MSNHLSLVFRDTTPFVAGKILSRVSSELPEHMLPIQVTTSLELRFQTNVTTDELTEIRQLLAKYASLEVK